MPPDLASRSPKPISRPTSCDGDGISYFGIKNVLSRTAISAPVAYECPLCCGLGRVRSDASPGEPTFGQLVPCPVCSTDRRQQWLAQNCGLIGEMMDVRLSSHWSGGNWTGCSAKEREARTEQRRVAWRAIKLALSKQSDWYTFWGDFGSGKSHALAIVVNEYRDRGIEAHYAPMAGVLDHLRSMYGTKQDTSTYWQRLLSVPVLALDEVTRLNATAWAMDKLFVLADQRYRLRRSHLTVLATNDDPRSPLPISEPFGYIFSRMREGIMVELRGDMRPGVRK